MSTDSRFETFVSDLAEALLKKDEALYRTTVSEGTTFDLGVNEQKSLLETAYHRAEELGGSIDEINGWVASIDRLYSSQEFTDALNQAKFIFKKELVTCGMNPGTDFELTPNGSIRIKSEKAWQALLERNEKKLLE